MTNEKLLEIRFKVIADYPDSVFKVDQIIQQEEIEENQYLYNMDFFPKFPHLFKKTEWWEERAIEDLPDYVKSLTTIGNIIRDEILKVRLWEKYTESEILVLNIKSAVFRATVKDKPNRLNISHFIPATESEYLQSKK